MGMVGSALVRRLQLAGHDHLILCAPDELDLRNQEQTLRFFNENKPEYVFMAAAKVGGIMANQDYPAEFLYNNLAIQNQVIHQCYIHKVKKLLFLGSSCIYPALAPQPIKEEFLLTGLLEPTNESYALAKIAGIKMCQAYHRQYGCNFISVMPCNLYGPNDNFDLRTAHVLPALLRKFHEARRNGSPSVTVWGTGQPRREFMHVDDLADACYFLMQHYHSSELINIGTGKDISIAELAELIKAVTGYSGNIYFDHTKPDGVLRKLLSVDKLHKLGWRHSIEISAGISELYRAIDWPNIDKHHHIEHAGGR